MATALPRSLLAGGAVSFALKDGTHGIIAQSAQRTYDHIIHSRVGNFPSSGLSDEQAKLILSASRLSDNEINTIWQRTEDLDAPGFPDGSWTQLETYVALHFIQIAENLSVHQMAIHFAKSLPSEPACEIRRKSSYTEAGLALRPNTYHNPIPPPSTQAATAVFRHSTSNATSNAGDVGPAISQVMNDRDGGSSYADGLEPVHLHSSTLPRLRHSRDPMRNSSFRTTTTLAAQRLEEWMESRCPRVEIEPDLDIVQGMPNQSSTVARADARAILIRQRRERPGFKIPSTRFGNRFKLSKARQKADDSATWTFTDYELSLALREVVQESHNVDAVKALVDMGADLNNIPEHSNFEGTRIACKPIKYAVIAVKRQHVEMVSFLASSTIVSENLLAALEQAVHQNSTELVEKLLRDGLCWHPRSDSIFSAAVASQNIAIIKLLLRSRWRPSSNSFTKNLSKAVGGGVAEIVALLVAYGADTAYDNKLALRQAVRAQRVDLVLVMMKGLNGISQSELASSVIRESFSNRRSANSQTQRQIIEILLSAGAMGDAVSQLLIEAVKADRRSIVALLVHHGVDLQYKDSEALRLAVSGDKEKILLALSTGRVRGFVASTLVDDIPLTCTDDRTYHVLALLIKKGAFGAPLDRALVRAVQDGKIRSAGLLLSHQTSINFNDFQALRIAVTGHNEAMLNLMLNKGSLEHNALPRLLPTICQLKSKLRFTMLQSLLAKAGQDVIEPRILTETLIEILRDRRRDGFPLPTVEVLTTAGADVTYMSGICLRLAVEANSIEIFELLIRILRLAPVGFIASMFKGERASRNLREDAGFILFEKDIHDRYARLELLLRAGIRQKALDRFLIREIETNRDIQITDLLLRYHASCEYKDGKSLDLAIQFSDTQIIARLISTGPNHRILEALIIKAAAKEDTVTRRSLLNLLLQNIHERENVSNALILEVLKTGDRDLQIIQLLMDHGAQIEHSDARAIKFAISKALDVDIVKALASGIPSLSDPSLGIFKSKQLIDKTHRRQMDAQLAESLLSSLIPLVMDHHQDIRLPVLQVILGKGAHGPTVDKALVTAASEGDHAYDTVDLLLRHNAKVNYNKAEAVNQAALVKSVRILERLLCEDPDPAYLNNAVEFAMQPPNADTKAQHPTRYQSVRLLTTSNALPLHAMNTPLIQALQEMDYGLIEHLIDQGADVNFDGGKGLVIAVQQLNGRSLGLLSKSKRVFTPQTCSAAFSKLPPAVDNWQSLPKDVQEFHRVLISGGATGPCVNGKFASAISSASSAATQFVHLVLAYKTPVDPNASNGEGLCAATRTARFDVVDFLLAWRPDRKTLQAGFMAVFDCRDGEAVLVSLVPNSNFGTSKSRITPLIMAATLANVEIVQRLLEARADPDDLDSAGRSPLQYATLANDIKSMECLLNHGADCNDESLHIAAKQLDLLAVTLLLDRQAEADRPGHIRCGGRTPLAELCRNADPSHNPPKLRKTIMLLCENTASLNTPLMGNPLIYQALGNNHPYKMASALLSSSETVCNALKDYQSNIYSEGTLRYTPTSYTRFFLCAQSPSHRNVDFSRRCCNLDKCPAPQIEDLLHTCRCHDRFWDAKGGLKQPKGLQNPPSDILDALEAAEIVRVEDARKEKQQRALDAAAAAERKRKRETMNLEKEERDAEIRAKKAQADADAKAIRQRAWEEEQAIRRLAEAETERAEAERQRQQGEYDLRRGRDQSEYREKQRRRKESNEEHVHMLREKSNVQIDQNRKEANITKEVMREQRQVTGERRKMIKDTTDMFREATYAGLTRSNYGENSGRN